MKMLKLLLISSGIFFSYMSTFVFAEGWGRKVINYAYYPIELTHVNDEYKEVIPDNSGGGYLCEDKTRIFLIPHRDRIIGKNNDGTDKIEGPCEHIETSKQDSEFYIIYNNAINADSQHESIKIQFYNDIEAAAPDYLKMWVQDKNKQQICYQSGKSGQNTPRLRFFMRADHSISPNACF